MLVAEGVAKMNGNIAGGAQQYTGRAVPMICHAMMSVDIGVVATRSVSFGRMDQPLRQGVTVDSLVTECVDTDTVA
jgi:hypothetical protein